MRFTEFLSAMVIVVVSLYIFFVAMPTSMLYTYHSIKPTKLVYTVGETLNMVSSITANYDSLSIEWNDELRCVKGKDRRIAASKTEGQLFLNDGKEGKTVWLWGKIPENTPLDVPCYIRSIQTVKFILGISKRAVYESDTFTVSEFDYTRQQQKEG